MNKSFVFWVEKYFYNPNLFQKSVSIVLLPLSYLYCLGMWLRYKSQEAEDFGIKIISVGNLNVGGSGKTPLVTALANKRKNFAIILRGYGRHSQGCIVIKDKKQILEDVRISGDEAMIYAQKLPNAIVIVSEDRKIAILKAKEMGVEMIFLDDAYSKHTIKKLDILIEVETPNNRCLPSGALRERVWNNKKVLIIKEGLDFIRKTKLIKPTAKMSLVTAIARPERLDEFLPPVVAKHYFIDHYSFNKKELLEILKKDATDSLLVTYKDYVKMQNFDLPLSILDLEIELGSFYKDIIEV